MQKLGSPLPTLGRQRNPFRAKKNPLARKGDRSFSPFVSDRERLERLADPGMGTLPERLVRAALKKIGLPFNEQLSVEGGNLSIGGAVVDFVVILGKPPGVVIRVQGDYWHSREPRKSKDLMQYQRLKAKGYRVADLWEGEIYEAALQGRLVAFVMQGIYGAT